MIQYINKSDLVAEIEERRDNLISLSESCPVNTAAKSGFYAQAQTLEGIKNFLDTLEAKEVDLENEIDEVTHNYKLDNHRHTSICSADIEWIAKHFFELGLKAIKENKL